MPTASAVVADMIDMAVGRSVITFKTLELWSEQDERIQLADPAQSTGRFYLRFNVVNMPGVLGQLAGRLGQHGITIASVVQHESGIDETPSERSQTVPVVMVTGACQEKDIAAALNEISALPTVSDTPERIRILD